MKNIPALLLVIFLEGYAVLSVELLAIRQLVPYVDSATDTISVIVAAVLLPLAFGYYAGGRFQKDAQKKLLLNLVIATAVLSVGLSYRFIDAFFGALLSNGIDNRVALTALYSTLFIAGPVYLLGQTVPLAANFFPPQKLPRLTGLILFISTIGSFMGAVFCTLVLMATIGVHHSVTISIACLAITALILSNKKSWWQGAAALACLGLAAFLNSGTVPQPQETAPTVSFREQIALSPQDSANYTAFIETNFLTPAKEKAILVIGRNASIGEDDTKNTYTRIDEIGAAETLRKNKYDLIIIDAAHGYDTIPAALVTREFFENIKAALNENGIVLANFPGSPSFANQFTADIDATFKKIFPTVNREIIGAYDGWTREPGAYVNILYTYFHQPMPDTPYTDNLNRSYYDRGRLIQ